MESQAGSWWWQFTNWIQSCGSAPPSLLGAVLILRGTPLNLPSSKHPHPTPLWNFLPHPRGMMTKWPGSATKSWKKFDNKCSNKHWNTVHQDIFNGGMIKENHFYNSQSMIVDFGDDVMMLMTAELVISEEFWRSSPPTRIASSDLLIIQNMGFSQFGQYISISVYQCTSIPLYQCTSIWVYQPTFHINLFLLWTWFGEWNFNTINVTINFFIICI